MITPIPWDDQEPTDAELAAIEAESPQIEADLALLDAQIRVLTADGGPTQIDWRRLRRAVRQVLAARQRVSAPATSGEVPGVAS